MVTKKKNILIGGGGPELHIFVAFVAKLFPGKLPWRSGLYSLKSSWRTSPNASAAHSTSSVSDPSAPPGAPHSLPDLAASPSSPTTASPTPPSASTSPNAPSSSSPLPNPPIAGSSRSRRTSPADRTSSTLSLAPPPILCRRLSPREKVVFMCLGDESSDYVLLTIHVSGELALFNSVEKRWTIIHEMPSPYDDVILFRGQFYAVDGTGRTVRVGLDSRSPSLAANPVYGGDKKFLVESSGELLVVDMYLSDDQVDWDAEDEVSQVQLNGCIYERTVRFKVYKVDEGGQKLVRMKSLGDRVLFLGDDCTFSASASELAGCKGNCIFFMDNFFYTSGEEEGTYKGRDIGVFDLDRGAITPLSDYPEAAKLFWPPPEWVSRTTSQVQTEFEGLAL
ncbi:hypothetical protein ACLB2K_011205 [Fragaria x ananassa]